MEKDKILLGIHMPICQKCNASFPNRIKINGTIKNICNRKFCLDCSPFKQHNTRNLVSDLYKEDDKKFCPRCKQYLNPNDFYNRRFRNGLSSYCKSCTVQQTIERQNIFKQRCLEYCGGKCVFCGYNKYEGALEFHHVNPSEKDFNISNVRFTSFDERVKRELDKCILLCSNCHREIHGGLIKVPAVGVEPT